MDKNFVYGLVIIFAIVFGFTYFTKQNEEATNTTSSDSTIVSQTGDTEVANESIAATSDTAQQTSTDTNKVSNNEPASLITEPELTVQDSGNKDSIDLLIRQREWGVFANTIEGEEKDIIIENEKIRLTISSKGGRIAKAELKEYSTHTNRKDSIPLVLFYPEASNFSLNFQYLNGTNGKDISTSELFFDIKEESFSVKGDEQKSLSARLYVGDDKYLEYLYTLKGNSYDVGVQMNFVKLDNVIYDRISPTLQWSMDAPKQEKSILQERRNSTVHYKLTIEDPDYLSESGDDNEEITSPVKWIGFKQQFFSSILIADKQLEDAILDVKQPSDSSDIVKSFSALSYLHFNQRPSDNFDFKFYFGPNHFSTLKKYEMGLEEQISLGPWIVSWINEYAVIPIFNFLDDMDLGYGWIILILTLIFKLVLFPVTYKTYLSSAKMKVLKPDIEAINKKHEKSDAVKKQQATMALYRSAGVNPLAGCIPMLIQMPILFALFRFFPSSIELRQESFLWAEDLSSYDAIFSWTNDIPLISSFYGNHVSLFTLLMAGSMFATMKLNSGQMGGASGQQAKQMKIIMNFMPVMMLFFFNSYASGLSYYYFLANMVTLGQQYFIKKFIISEEAIRKKIELNKQKPKKKSSFQKRMEDVQKQRGMKR